MTATQKKINLFTVKIKGAESFFKNTYHSFKESNRETDLIRTISKQLDVNLITFYTSANHFQYYD